MGYSCEGGKEMTQYLLVMTTVPDADVGQIIAEKIIEERLAACVTLPAASQSLYWWKGKITQNQEHTLFIKTKKEAYSKLEEKIQGIHPYDIPEIIALPILTGSKDYLGWIDRETQA
jgi:periplasmic divalent cation tolerance protein